MLFILFFNKPLNHSAWKSRGGDFCPVDRTHIWSSTTQNQTRDIQSPAEELHSAYLQLFLQTALWGWRYYLWLAQMFAQPFANKNQCAAILSLILRKLCVILCAVVLGNSFLLRQHNPCFVLVRFISVFRAFLIDKVLDLVRKSGRRFRHLMSKEIHEEETRRGTPSSSGLTG